MPGRPTRRGTDEPDLPRPKLRGARVVKVEKHPYFETNGRVLSHVRCEACRRVEVIDAGDGGGSWLCPCGHRWLLVRESR